MDIDKAIRVALEVANDGKPNPEGQIAKAESATETVDAQVQEVPSASIRKLLPTETVAAALTLVQTIAHGRDPYTTDDSSKHLPEQNPETVKALCVVAAYLLQLGGLPNRALDTASTSETPRLDAACGLP